MDISIGKFTLESLTTGMYSEPESCFREYIQNAVDSIDMAIDQGLLQLDESRIEIIVDEDHREISIKDNGTGISSSLARKTLLDIGNSTKLHTVNRGFRGIGRLGGLSYCKQLSFCTTSRGEDVKTVVTFDCERLRQLLIPGQGDEHTLQSVIEAVTNVTVLEEQSSSHYFIVKMEDVDDIATLLDIELVRDYVSQVAPLPFRKAFYWGGTIKQELKSKGITIEEYPIFVGRSFEKLTQIYKPYKITQDVALRSGISKDEISGISFFDVATEDNTSLAYGWYADTEFSGTLADDRMSGIRVRLGNILIGNAKTLSPYFKESRFNGWVLGELYILSPNLIPNARRDDFERNDTFTQFENGVRITVGSEVSDKIRAASKARNNPSAKTIKKAEKTITQGGHASFMAPDAQKKFISLINKRVALSIAAGALIEDKERELSEINQTQDVVIDLLSHYPRAFIIGGAGTGKTWIGIKKIKRCIAEGKRPLYLCYNRTLAERVQTHISSFDADVYSIDDIASSLLGDSAKDAPVSDGCKEYSDMLEQLPALRQYDLVVVDEAQDFTEDWAYCANLLVKDNGSLYVFYDESQNVFSRDFGDKFFIDGEPFVLRYNIRNTSNIYQYTLDRTSLGTDTLVNQIEGVEPDERKINRKQAVISFIDSVINKLVNREGVSPEKITILSNRGLDQSVLSDVYYVGGYPLVSLENKNDKSIAFSTVEAFKGLESDIVIFINHTYRDEPKTEEIKSIQYTSLTRARFYLYVIDYEIKL